MTHAVWIGFVAFTTILAVAAPSQAQENCRLDSPQIVRGQGGAQGPVYSAVEIGDREGRSVPKPEIGRGWKGWGHGATLERGCYSPVKVCLPPMTWCATIGATVSRLGGRGSASRMQVASGRIGSRKVGTP